MTPISKIWMLPQALRYRVQLLRCKDCSVQSGVFLLGAFFADDLLARGWGFIAVSLVLSGLCLAYGYSLNEFYDELKDRLAGDARTSTELLRFIYVLLALALGVAWFISITTLIIVAMIGVTVWLHSSPPFRLKRQLFWRLFLNSFGFGLFFLVGASLDNQLIAGEILMGVFIFGLYLPLELIHVLAHMEDDRAKNLPTVALIYGEKKTIILAMIVLGGLILYSGVLWQFEFVSLALAAWSGFHLSLLLLSLVAFSRRENNMETYRKLRLRTRIVCAIYGSGMLAILIFKI